MTTKEAQLYSRYKNELCYYYFNKSFINTTAKESTFISIHWLQIMLLEAKQHIAYTKFLKKYKLRLKLVRP